MTVNGPMRSWLYVPGDDAHKIAKAAATDADVIILDLEDGVSATNKDKARQVISGSLRDAAFGRSSVFVRINALGTGRWKADVEVACAAGADGIVIPKASSPDGLKYLEAFLEDQGLAPPLAPIVTEDVVGFFAASETIVATGRVAAVLWGSEDLSASLGAWRVKDEQGRLLEVFQVVRSLTLLQAARHGKPAIDTPFLAIGDENGLEVEAREAAWMGFAGKQAIHPAQIPVINEAFTPAQRDVQEARALVDAFERNGDAVVRIADQMADSPHLLRARHILAVAESLDQA